MWDAGKKKYLWIKKKFFKSLFRCVVQFDDWRKEFMFFLQSKQHSTFLRHVSGAGSIRKKSDKRLEALDLNMLHETTETISVS